VRSKTRGGAEPLAVLMVITTPPPKTDRLATKGQTSTLSLMTLRFDRGAAAFATNWCSKRKPPAIRLSSWPGLEVSTEERAAAAAPFAPRRAEACKGEATSQLLPWPRQSPSDQNPGQSANPPRCWRDRFERARPQRRERLLRARSRPAVIGDLLDGGAAMPPKSVAAREGVTVERHLGEQPGARPSSSRASFLRASAPTHRRASRKYLGSGNDPRIGPNLTTSNLVAAVGDQVFE